MSRRFLLLSSFLLVTSSLFARRAYVSPIHEDHPWMTGPLITPGSYVNPVGHSNLNPVFTVMKHDAHYDSHWKKVKAPYALWTNYFQPYFAGGLTKWMDISIIPMFFLNEAKGSKSLLFSDFSVVMSFQLLDIKQPGFLSSLRLYIRETFPIGVHDHLKSNHYFSDCSGTGSYLTWIGLSSGFLFHIRNDHWLNTRLSSGCILPSRVHVKGINFFGGTDDTNGTVYPPNELNVEFAYEFSLTKHWVIACDHVAAWAAKRRFKGDTGQPDPRIPTGLIKGSSFQFSLAPALEYNWNANNGVITGPWFSVAGRNSDYFFSWMFSYSLVY